MFARPVAAPTVKTVSRAGLTSDSDAESFAWFGRGPTNQAFRRFSGERSGQLALPDTAAGSRTSWDFSQVPISARGAEHRGRAPLTVVEPVNQAGGDDEEPQALKRLEAPASAPKNLLVAALPQPVSLHALGSVARRDGAFVTGPPVPKDLSAISAGGGVGAAGYTDWPVGFKAPDFDFKTAMGAGAGAASGLNWTCDPILKTAAAEGASGSFYTAPGRYKTNGKEGDKDVYWRFSPAISALVKTGEQEHCDDYAEAFKISLQEAESVLKANVIGQMFGPAASASDAEGLVLKAISDNLTHKALGSDRTKWSATYTMLFRKTSTRDTTGWHTITLGSRTETATDVTYDVVKGSSQIGSHPSSAVVSY
jgi:hypothetical protein